MSALEFSIPITLRNCKRLQHFTMACYRNESVVNIFKEKCQHGPAERHFNVVNHDLTFEKFESHYRCELTAMNTVFLAENDSGPWTELADAMYSMPIRSILRSFPNTKYIKLICLPPEQQDGPQTSDSSQNQHPQNVFDIMMKAGNNLWQNPTARLPDKKESRY